MQVATTAILIPGHEEQAMRYIDVALSLGWPSDARDVQQVYSLVSRRAGRHEPATASAPGETFAALMIEMQSQTSRGDLDRAYEASARWVALVARTGLSGIPHTSGYWLPEMRTFRADPRFPHLARQLGFSNYWAATRPADDCTLRPVLRCSVE